MGFQYFSGRSMMRSSGYERLTYPSSEKMTRLGRRCWVKSMNGRFRGLRLSRSRKLCLRAFNLSSVVLPRIVRMYSDVVNRMNQLENVLYPAVLVPTQWGLPVMSHPSSLVCRRSVNLIPLQRKVTCCY